MLLIHYYFIYIIAYCYPLQIIIIIAMLFSLLGVSAFVGLIAMLLTYPIPAYISQSFAKFQKRLMAATDKRLGVMNEVIYMTNKCLLLFIIKI